MLKNLLFVLAFYFSFVGWAGAASLEMRPSLLVAGGFKLEAYLNPAGESLNAIEGKLKIPEFLKIREIRFADSVVSFWLEKPQLQDGFLVWSGVMPGGFEGVLSPYQKDAAAGKLFEIFFTEKPTQAGEFNLSDGRVFLNDGLGTAKNLPTFKLAISPESLIGSPIKGELRDILPPEEFTPLISRTSDLFNNQWFLSFTAADKQSGVAAYFVYESIERETSIPENRWQKAESPHLLKDQSLKSYIFVRAVDGFGNERIVVLEPSELSSYPSYWQWIIIILVALGAAVLIFSRVNRRK